jgi:MFS family permease
MLNTGLISTNANFRFYFAGQATSELGNGLVPVVFAFAALQVAPSGGVIPLVLLALWVTRVVLLPLGSVVAERYNKANVMLFSDIGRLAAQLIAMIPFVLGTGAAWHLILSAGVYGACTAFFVPASFAGLPRIVGREDLQRANALLGMARNVGLIVGPALGGLLVTAGGVALALAFDVFTFVVSVGTLAMLRSRFGDAVEDPRSPADGESGKRAFGFVDGLRIIPRVPGVVGVLALYCTVQFGNATVGVLGPVVANQSMGGIGSWSAIVTAMATGGLVGGAVATRLQVQNPIRWTLVAFGVFTPLEMVALAVPFAVWVVVMVILCTTVVAEIAGVVFDAYIQRSAPQEYLARVGAVESALLGVMNPIGVAVAFPLASGVGISSLLVGVGVVVLITALGAGISARRIQLRQPGQSSTRAEMCDESIRTKEPDGIG